MVGSGGLPPGPLSLSLVGFEVRSLGTVVCFWQPSLAPLSESLWHSQSIQCKQPHAPGYLELSPCVWRAPEGELAQQDKAGIWSIKAWTQTPALPFLAPAFISWHLYAPGPGV